MGKTIRGKTKKQKAKLIKGYQRNTYANRSTRRKKAKRSGVFNQKGTWKAINHNSRSENRQTVMRERDKRGNVSYNKPPTNKGWHDRHSS